MRKKNNVHTNNANYTKPVQLVNWNSLCMFLYIQIMYKLYKNIQVANWNERINEWNK